MKLYSRKYLYLACLALAVLGAGLGTLTTALVMAPRGPARHEAVITRIEPAVPAVVRAHLGRATSVRARRWVWLFVPAVALLVVLFFPGGFLGAAMSREARS